MREIKFRAWDHEDKKMWKVVAISDSIWGDCEEAHIRICDFDKNPSDIETDVRLSVNFDLMQFTGLKENGREIYEGDIYSYTMTIDGSHWNEHKVECFDVVKFEDGAFYHGVHLLSDVIEYDETFTYVGNIYENKELLDGAK